MSDKYPSLSPYTYCANNPVKLVDPNGESISEFDENGNYLRTIKDNWFHNVFFGRIGRIVDEDGNPLKDFTFADPKHDIQNLKDGTITKVQFVNESEINQMLSRAGAFDKENKTYNNSTLDRYKYIHEHGQGNGLFDFAVTAIPYFYEDAGRSLFLVEGVAHNLFNFGNFLFGAAGEAIGLSLDELSAGAHYNSLVHPRKNGYLPQFDSKDDQYSIKMGFYYAKKNNYKEKYYHITIGKSTRQ